IVDDGVRLWVDNQLVIDEWRNQGATLYTHELELKKGQKYAIKLEYYQGGGSAVVNLGLKIPGQESKEEMLSKVDTVYLPNGTGWYDYWTNDYHKAGRTVSKEYPIDIFPLFVKAGSIIPFGPQQQYVDEKPDAPIELKIYTGEDAEFVLYEDEGENYNYEDGQYNTIALKWSEKKQTLVIGESTGSFAGFNPEKTFNVTVFAPGETSKTRTIQYRSERVEVDFRK
ncbi:MAG: DUF5110 domain-containing protein, partial [Bacteroidota bacterium]